jgi:cytochrome c oxidase subunit 4
MSEHASHTISKTTYLSVFVALLVLTALTVYTANFDLGAWNTPVALSIALIKAAMIILYFMHARFSTWLTRTVIVGGFFFLVIMLGLTFADYVSRETVSPLPYLQ